MNTLCFRLNKNRQRLREWRDLWSFVFPSIIAVILLNVNGGVCIFISFYIASVHSIKAVYIFIKYI